MASARIRRLGPRAVPGDLIVPFDNDTRCCFESSACGNRTSPSLGHAKEAVCVREMDNKEETEAFSISGDIIAPSPCFNASSKIGKEHEKKTVIFEGFKERKDGDIGDSAGVERERGMMRGLVTVLKEEDIEAFTKNGVTPEELLRRVVMPLPGTAVDYPTHQVRWVM